MTSSPGSMPPQYEAIIQCDQQGRGPVRLPLQDADLFIAEFNRKYGDHGMSVIAINQPMPLANDKATVR